MNKVGRGGNHLWMMLEEFQLRTRGGFPVMLAFSSEHLGSLSASCDCHSLFSDYATLIVSLEQKREVPNTNDRAPKQIIGLWLTRKCSRLWQEIDSPVKHLNIGENSEEQMRNLVTSAPTAAHVRAHFDSPHRPVRWQIFAAVHMQVCVQMDNQ